MDCWARLSKGERNVMRHEFWVDEEGNLRFVIIHPAGNISQPVPPATLCASDQQLAVRARKIVQKLIGTSA